MALLGPPDLDRLELPQGGDQAGRVERRQRMQPGAQQLALLGLALFVKRDRFNELLALGVLLVF